MKEYSILMLKPNACFEEFINDVFDNLKKLNLEVIYEKKILLTIDDINKCFLHKDIEYVKYITSGDVIFYIVYGYDAHEKLYKMKHYLRKKFHVTNTIKNLIHSTDSGNEYHMWLGYFFPELESKKYSNSGDFNVLINRNKKIENQLFEIINKTNIRYCAINITNLEEGKVKELFLFYNNKLIIYYTFEIRICYGNEFIKTLVYFKEKDYDDLKEYINKPILMNDLENIINKYGVTVYLYDFPIPALELKKFRKVIFERNINLSLIVKKFSVYSLLKQFKQIGIDGLFCYSPKYSLEQGELYMELCELIGLSSLGGSCGLTDFGNFSVSIETITEFNLLFNIRGRK